nr:retrotransposon protein, putative, Ty1-copia subclass [Tanacetum cinerariifolium]
MKAVRSSSHVSCMSGKMARKPYSHQVDGAKYLLGLIHTDVCGPFKTVSRHAASYFVTFTDNFSRYGYVYLLKHKHEVFETFKVFQKEVENQLGKTIKLLRSDRGGECMSQEFLDHLKEHVIIAHRTPPYTSQHNEMQSMKDSKVWDLVDLPPNGKTVGSKWLFKKKTDTDDTSLHHDKDDQEIDEPQSDINPILLHDVKSYLERCFAMKDLREAAYILGIKIYRDRSKQLIGLCQSAYIEKILKRYFMENSKSGTIPMQEKLKLSKSQGNMKRELRVSCYTDAGYLTDADDLMSQTGYVFVLNGGAVDWKSTKQSIFATSFTDVEYIATFDASKKAV